MLIGDFEYIVESDDGSVVLRAERTAHTGHPAEGNEVELNGNLYQVVRLKFIDDDGSTLRRYVYTQVFLRANGNGPKPRRPNPSPPTGVPDDRGGRVLAFRAPHDDRPGARLQAVILPVGLVAVLVACGYRAQALYYRECSEATALLVRQGHRWVVERLPSSDELWALSREAKSYFVAAIQVAAELSRPRLRLVERDAA